MSALKKIVKDKKMQVVGFASTAISLYGYDQGMMSLINTNHDYLATMGIEGTSPLVATIVSVYYIGCAVGAILASRLADKQGRKDSIFACLATAAAGNLLMFFSGLGFRIGALPVMITGRIVMGLGVGGLDSVIPVYSSELSDEGSRGRAMGQEFQGNILGLNIAFAINLLVTRALGKSNQWAWRVPIIAMQAYTVTLLSFVSRLPESPRWLLAGNRENDAYESLKSIYTDNESLESEMESLKKSRDEEASEPVKYRDMLLVGGSQFHPTMIVILGQVNQALTGYGCLSVYGPQIFMLLGFTVEVAENMTQANYLSYFALMTVAWLLMDVLGRRVLMLWGSAILSASFLLLALFAGLVMTQYQIWDVWPLSITGVVIIFIATGAFGIGWLTQAWLIPTELFPAPARARGAAVSVIIWGFANFAITFLSPIFFNNLKFWIFLIFAVTNVIAGVLTWLYSPETGGRPFEENARFFIDAKKEQTWVVSKVNGGEFCRMPHQKSKRGNEGERTPLLDG